jgi:hypothetical protein
MNILSTQIIHVLAHRVPQTLEEHTQVVLYRLLR